MNKSLNQSNNCIDLSKYLLSSSKIQDQEDLFQQRESQSFLLETTEFMKEQNQPSNIDKSHQNLKDSHVFDQLQVTLSKIQENTSLKLIENNSQCQQLQKQQTKEQIQELQNICKILLKTNKDLVSKISKIEQQKQGFNQKSFGSCKQIGKQHLYRDSKRNDSQKKRESNDSVHSYRPNGINFGLSQFQLILNQYKNQISELKKENKMLKEENNCYVRTTHTLKIQLKSLNSENVKLFQQNNGIKQLNISLKQKLQTLKKQLNILKQSKSCKIINDEDEFAYNNKKIMKNISQAKSFNEAKNITETNYYNSNGKQKYQSVLNSFNSCKKTNLKQQFDKELFQKKIRLEQMSNKIKLSPKTPCPTPNYIKFQQSNKNINLMQEYQITSLKEPALNELAQNRLQKIMKQHQFQARKKKEKQMNKYKNQKQLKTGNNQRQENSLEDSFQKYFISQPQHQETLFNQYENLEESTVKTQKILQNSNICIHKNKQNINIPQNEYNFFNIKQKMENKAMNFRNISPKRTGSKQAFTSFRQVGKINNLLKEENQLKQNQNQHKINNINYEYQQFTPIFYSPCHRKMSKSPLKAARNEKHSTNKGLFFRR